MNNCPWCGARGIDITTADDELGFDRRRAYMCVGADNHRWRDGDGPEPELPSLIILASS